MTYEVEMHAFAEGKTRRVNVPDDEDQTLGNIFKYGQNDFAGAIDLMQQMPSVSVGDIIRLRGWRYVVMPNGFKKVSDTFKPPPQDRGGLYAYFPSSFDEEEGA
jgi:hypothetical protein